MRSTAGFDVRIAMIGQRGLPASFGGVERAVEEIGAELASRGHEVVVYCRKAYSESNPTTWRGMELDYHYAPDSKHLEAFVHTGLATGAALRQQFDVVHYHALGPGLFTPLSKGLSSAAVVQTIHGLDYSDSKWRGFAQQVLRLGGWMSAHVPDATVVVSQDLQDFFEKRWSRLTYYVPNGVTRPDAVGEASLLEERFGVLPGEYVLFVGRLIPEKATDLLLRTYAALDTSRPLVIAGGSSHSDDYVHKVEALASHDPRVVLTGYVYGRALAELYAHARVFVLPSLREGLPLALLEAAAYGRPIVASAIPPHVQVLGADRPGVRLFERNDQEGLRRALAQILAGDGDDLGGSTQLRDHVLENYTWSRAADRLEDVYRLAVDRRRKRRMLARR